MPAHAPRADAPAPRLYPAVGGIFAWRVPGLTALFALCGLVVDGWVAAAFIGCLGLAGGAVERAVAFEATSAGLARVLTFAGVPLGSGRLLAWNSITRITTRWTRPRDFTALETIVIDESGESVRFGSRMGLAAYRALIADVARHAPAARREGLTDQILAESFSRGAII
jgi:hypothetical protein